MSGYKKVVVIIDNVPEDDEPMLAGHIAGIMMRMPTTMLREYIVADTFGPDDA